MKKQLLTLSILAALPLTLSAQTYVGGKAGYSFLKNSCVASEPCDDTSVGFGGYLGYQFDPAIAIELGVEKIGDFKTNYGAGTELNGDLTQVTLAPKFNAPITSGLDFYGKLGASFSKYKSDDNFGLLSALGLEYFINKNLSTRLEYQMTTPLSFETNSGISANLVSLGLTYKFGAPEPMMVKEEPMPEPMPMAEPKPEPAPEPVVAAVAATTVTFQSQKDVELFETGSNKLSDSALHQFDDVVETLLKYPQAEATVVGHTDSKGAAAFNQKLSEQRAQAVADYIESKGVAADRLTIRGDGEANPIATNDTAAGRKENRRVEVTIEEFTVEK
ncbi:OmpA family protein [Vibrio sp. SCSIO 43136]|uniref:OmpA family protein n=1 Tax=Vibrio sp. SCSIO 43136 TaxID=2819101 RepID=UPI0020758F6F|nr:OmpA family protein [Vibrio sp. SCSIO 43136]USD68240.1 OmpA family protein [Vibrio sp. SCSIO 43136]